ncbi:acyl-CoA reductase [Rubritalea spongiae]|uniref:Acyl-CoA reductase n=1 Tax=Rubritalea spongiae TaxID=430797 RepID=A0ABW5E0U1_9BACT
MTTEQRALELAKASEAFSKFLGEFSANDLLDWVSHELGHPAALDDYQQVGDILTKATPPRHLLHIISGNTPHAGLQSLLRGLLIGANNIVKLPSQPTSADDTAILPEIRKFHQSLSPSLQSLSSFTHELDDKQLHSADTVVAIGSDQAIEAIHSRLIPKQRFIPHGHKISFALIDKPSSKNAQLAAVDASLFNQQGCLSPHAIYVKNNASDFAPMLATAMQDLSQKIPRSPISISESGAIRNLRETLRFQAAQDPANTQLYESDTDTSWTVIYENDSTLRPSPQNRVIFVRPWPSTPEDLGNELEYLSTIALSPLSGLLKEVECLKPPRICQLGKAQQPHLFWHHDGFAPLASLVTWQDIHL